SKRDWSSDVCSSDIEGIQIEGKEATIEEKDDHTNHTFNLSNLKKELNSKVQYAVPSIGMEHDVPFKFILEGLDELPKKDKNETKTETKTEEIEFEEERINDSTLEKGKTKVKQAGQNGEKEVIYEVTYSNGKETSRSIKNEVIAKDPVNKIILIGTKEPKPDENDKPKPENPNEGDGEESEVPSKPTKDDLVDGIHLKNGVYELDYKVDYEGEDFSKHFTQPAILTVKNNKTNLEFKHKDIGFINGITIPKGKVEIINENKEKQTRVVSFNINNDISNPVDMGLKMVYGMTHKVKLNFNLDFAKESIVEVKTETKTETIDYKTVKEKNSSLEKGKTKVKQKGQKGEKEVTYEVTYKDGKKTDRKPKGKDKIIKETVDEIILVGNKDKKKNEKVKDGTYDIIAKAMHKTKNEASGAAGFINEDAKLSIKNGKIELTIAVPDNPMAEIKGIEVE